MTQSNHSTNKKNWERFQVNVRILNPKILKWSATPCFNQRPRVKHHVCSERMSNAARFLRTRRGFNLSVYCLRYRVFGMLKVTCSSCATLCSHALHLLKTVFRVFSGATVFVVCVLRMLMFPAQGSWQIVFFVLRRSERLQATIAGNTSHKW